MVVKTPTDINFASTTYPLAYTNMQGDIRIQKTSSLTKLPIDTEESAGIITRV